MRGGHRLKAKRRHRRQEPDGPAWRWNVADKDKVCAVALHRQEEGQEGRTRLENQMGLLEEESEEGTLAIDDLDDLDDDLGDEGEETEE